MRLRHSTLSSLISFLLGAGWGLALVGALSMFFSFFHISIFIALISMITGALPGLLLVVFLEYMLLKDDMLTQIERQSKLLEEIKHKLDR